MTKKDFQEMDKMIADILILSVIGVCCGLIIRRQIKNRKNPQAGCSGCSGCGGNCPVSREKGYCNIENTGK